MEPAVLRLGFGGLFLPWFLSPQVQSGCCWDQGGCCGWGGYWDQPRAQLDGICCLHDVWCPGLE